MVSMRLFKSFVFLSIAFLCLTLYAVAQTPTPAPVILKTLSALQDGQIMGANFGAARGKLYAIGRFDMTSLCTGDANAAKSQWLQFYDCKPKAGEQLVPDAVISSWTATAITLAWPKATKTAFIKSLRVNSQNGAIDAQYPFDSVEFAVELPDGTKSSFK